MHPGRAAWSAPTLLPTTVSVLRYVSSRSPPGSESARSKFFAAHCSWNFRGSRYPAHSLPTGCRSIDHHTKMLQSFWCGIVRDGDAPTETRSAVSDAPPQLKVG